MADDLLIGGSTGRSRWGKFNPQGKHGSYVGWPSEKVTKDLERRVNIRKNRLKEDLIKQAERDYWKKKNEKLVEEAEARKVPTKDVQAEIDKKAKKDLDKQAADEEDRTPIGGWNPKDVPSSFRNALTIANAARKGRQLLAVADKTGKTIGAVATALKALTIGEF